MEAWEHPSLVPGSADVREPLGGTLSPHFFHTAYLLPLVITPHLRSLPTDKPSSTPRMLLAILQDVPLSSSLYLIGSTLGF